MLVIKVNSIYFYLSAFLTLSLIYAEESAIFIGSRIVNHIRKAFPESHTYLLYPIVPNTYRDR